MDNPLSNTPTPTRCDGKNWFGWPCDEELEKIRLEFPLAPPRASRRQWSSGSEALLRSRAVHPGRPVLRADRLPQDLNGDPGHVAARPVEHREEVFLKPSGFPQPTYVRRLLATIPVMGVVAVVVFLLLHLAPGDPAAIIAGDLATAEDIAQHPQQLGLDQPLHIQFVAGSASLLGATLAPRSSRRSRVSTLIAQRLEPTLVAVGDDPGLRGRARRAARRPRRVAGGARGSTGSSWASQSAASRSRSSGSASC